MKILLIFVGKTTEDYLKDGIEIYLKRISNYIGITTLVVPGSAIKDGRKAMEEEGSKIKAKLLPGDFVVVLDEKGSMHDSRQLADIFQKWMLQSIGRVVFITGGAFGIAPDLKQKARLLLSVSKLTFTHQMVRLILTEQIYRAMTIIKNEGYHHD